MTVESKTISALKWATVAKVVVQAVSWASTLIVIRLLTPDDYGLMAKVSVVSSIAGTIAELGLGAAIVRAGTLTRDELRKIFGVSLLFGAAVTLAIMATSPLLAQLFHEPRLAWPIAGASLQILIGTIVLVPASLATRDLSFRHLSKIEMVSGIATALATLSLAWAGFGVWALVLGTLIGALVRAAGFLRSSPLLRPLFSTAGMGEHLRFGLTLVSNRVSYFFVTQADVVVGSAFLSTTEIGQYAVALQLATLPMSKVMGTINSIALPAVARKQDDLAGVRLGLIRALTVIALAAFPVIWSISALAPEIVRSLFGPKWEPVVPALQILPLIVPVRMISSVLLTTALALGFRNLDLRNTVSNMVLIPGGFFIGAHWGLMGLCLSWLVSVPLAYTVSLPSAVRNIGISARELLSAVGPPVVGSLVMYGAIAAGRQAAPQMPPLLGLVLLGALGLGCYLATVAMVSPRHLQVAREFGRSLRKKPSAPMA